MSSSPRVFRLRGDNFPESGGGAIHLAEGFCEAVDAPGGVDLFNAVHQFRRAQALVAALSGDL
jgi:hypothetical protein